MKTMRLVSVGACFATTLLFLLLWFPAAAQAQPRIPTVTANFGVRNNAFGFDILSTNALVAVESCTNLASPVWLGLSTNVLNSGSGYFADTDWTNYPRRFYRARNLGDGLYSTNIVGFVRLVVHPDYNLLANPLSVGFTNGANEVLPPIEGAQILTWNGTRFDYVSYDTGFGGWIDANWNPASPPLLPPGNGFFLFNPNTTSSILTFVGAVVPGPCTTNVMNLPPGYSLIGSPFPADANPINAAPVSLPLIDGMILMPWRHRYYDLRFWDIAFGGWIDADFNPRPPPTHTAGEGFFLYLPSAASWVQIGPCP